MNQCLRFPTSRDPALAAPGNLLPFGVSVCRACCIAEFSDVDPAVAPDTFKVNFQNAIFVQKLRDSEKLDLKIFFRITSATTHQISIPTSLIKLTILLETMNLSHDSTWLGLLLTNMHIWMLPDQTIFSSMEDTLINVDLVKGVDVLQIHVSNKFSQAPPVNHTQNISMDHTLPQANKCCRPMIPSNDAIE